MLFYLLFLYTYHIQIKVCLLKCLLEILKQTDLCHDGYQRFSFDMFDRFSLRTTVKTLYWHTKYSTLGDATSNIFIKFSFASKFILKIGTTKIGFSTYTLLTKTFSRDHAIKPKLHKWFILKFSNTFALSNLLNSSYK